MLGEQRKLHRKGEDKHRYFMEDATPSGKTQN